MEMGQESREVAQTLLAYISQINNPIFRSRGFLERHICDDAVQMCGGFS